MISLFPKNFPGFIIHTIDDGKRFQMNAAVTQQFSSDLEPFFDDNACSYELCTGILYQGCQSFQRFSVCQEIIDQENFVSFSQKFFGNSKEASKWQI